MKRKHFNNYTTKNPLKLKLKNKYELPSFKTMSSLDFTELKFTVQDLEKDKTAIFEYDLNKDTDSLGNPFTVCEGSNCQKKISTYEFKKGKTYTILVGVKKEEIDHIDYIMTPGFSFYAQDYDGKYHEDDISYDSNSNSNYIRLNLFLGCLMLFYKFINLKNGLRMKFNFIYIIIINNLLDDFFIYYNI